ncbi:MAG: hypothetical protein WAU70_11710 [Flavobacteriales bacterium]
MRKLLLTLLAFNGLSALFGGGVFIARPDGSVYGMPLSMLADTPFVDFLVPGLILFTVLGLGSCIGWILVLRRSPFSVRWVQVVGVGTVIWIVTQVIMIHGVDVLHVIYAATGVALTVLATRGTRSEHVPGS